LKSYIKYKNRYNFPILIFLLGFAASLVSCSTTKYVGENEYLLQQVVVKTDDKSISTSELKRNIKQKPNLKILGAWRFHLGLYNLSGRNGKKGINKWLRRIGEEPVIYDDFQTQRSIKQLKIFLQKKGYYDAEIMDTVVYRKKKAKVYYTIKAHEPYRYQKIYNQVGDLPENFLSSSQKKSELVDSNLIRKYIVSDTIHSAIKKNEKVDSDLLSSERNRIAKMLKNKGYFNFSREYIHFMMDSTSKDHHMDVFVGVKEPVDERVKKKYKINDICIFTDYDPKQMLMNDSIYLSQLDTMTFEGVKFIYRNKMKLTPNILLSTIQLHKGDLYQLKKVEETYTRLQSLNQFKFLNVKFQEEESEGEFGKLNCILQLTPYNKQFYSVELEGTNSSGNIGFSGNLNYQHRNLFKGAEVLDVQLSLSKETIKSNDQSNFNSSEYGIKAKMSIPKFMLPFFSAEKFRKTYYPKTTFSLSYNYQERPDYTRTIVDASFGYLWKSSKYIQHTFNLLELNFVDVKNLSSNFFASLKNLYIRNSFSDHVIATSRYSFTYNDQNMKAARNFTYFRFNFETAGNTLNLYNSLRGQKKKLDINSEGEVEGKYHQLFGIRYAQYLKADVEYRFKYYMNRANSLVYRVFFGMGYPYGNLDVLPFEKSYFSGGSNGIRAWQVRSLGPGSYDGGTSNYPNNTADLKIEANIEYRFKLLGALEGALFLDAGNIWSISEKDDRPGADFEFDRFYKEIALGSGFGVRADLKFILFRLDLGLKLRDPSLTEGERWIIKERPFKFSQFVYNIGIGYPF